MARSIVAKLKEIYFHELGFQCTAVQGNCERVFQYPPPPPGERNFVIEPATLHVAIGGALGAAANVKKLLDDKRPRNKKTESAGAFDLRKARAQMLTAELNGIPLDEILKVSVRNSLEHFDEYLDKENIRLNGQLVPCVTLYNVGVSHLDDVIFDEGPTLHIRTYETSTRRFFNLGRSINLGKVHDEAVAILARLIDRKLVPANGTTGVMSFLDFPGEPATPGPARKKGP
jgi:hypothetical protein